MMENLKSSTSKQSKDLKSPVKIHIPPDIMTYLTKLEQLINEDKAYLSFLCDIFKEQLHPFLFALDFFYYATVKTRGKGKVGKMAIIILESLKKYSNQINISLFLTKNIKEAAISTVLKSPSLNAAIMISEIYHLKDEEEYVKQVISQLLAEKKFKEGFYFISALNMENEYPLTSCAFPLFFLGQDSFLKLYLSKSQPLQIEFLKILDELCSNALEFQNFVVSIGIDSVKNKNMKLNLVWLKKKLPSLLDHFDIDIRNCKNMYRIRCEGAMHYLFRKRYVDNAIPYEPWEENVVDILADHPDLQQEMLVKLVSYNELPAAFRLAGIWRYPEGAWPLPPNQNRTYPDPRSSDPPRDPGAYLQLRLNLSDVHVVDTPELVYCAVDDIADNYDMVGLDAEWKPNMGIRKERTSLLQLAVWDSVYLFDILALREYCDSNLWEYLMSRIFFNKELMKLGYGGANDLSVLLTTVGFEGNDNDNKVPGLVDLAVFFNKLKAHYPEVSSELSVLPRDPVLRRGEKKGLSHLCHTALGRPLDKGEQFSNWERRPLRETQLRYAALDAYCLLMIYEKLYPLLKKWDLTFEKVFTSNRIPPKDLPKDVEPISVQDFRVVVDNVGGITKYLRLLGADVVSLTDMDDHMKAVEIAQKENRVIISSGAAYNKVRGYMPEGMCFCADPKLNPKQLIADILKFFNVHCEESDIFSRCSLCNSRDYIEVEAGELHSLWTRFVGPGADPASLHRKNGTVFRSDVTSADARVHRDQPLQLAAFSPQIFDHVTRFLVCARCGKVYWEGSHLSRLKESMGRFVTVKRAA